MSARSVSSIAQGPQPHPSGWGPAVSTMARPGEEGSGSRKQDPGQWDSDGCVKVMGGDGAPSFLGTL